jgi:imidazolonepropionase-like amidohydrolase
MSLTGHHRVQALVGATVIDGRGGMPIRRGVILVEDNCIAKVGTESTVPVPREATVIDLGGFFVLPGLIDCHIHLSGRRTMDTRGEVFTSPGLMTARAVADARTLLESGFTTVRDAGGRTALAVRDAIAEGSIPGPRILCAGPFVEPTGGADDLSFIPEDWTLAPSRSSIKRSASWTSSSGMTRSITGRKVPPAACSINAVMSARRHPFEPRTLCSKVQM